MKLSARHQLKGKIIDVKKGATTTHVGRCQALALPPQSPMKQLTS